MDANFGYYNGFAMHIPPPDSELTNLNWVSGAPVPMLHPVSPTRKGAASRSKHAQREEARPNFVTKSAKQSCSQTSTISERQERSCGDAHGCETPHAQPLKKETPRREKTKDSKICKGKKDNEEEETKDKKPNCSYTSLIGLALMASEAGCLPVSEIYAYIEEEFPYFRSAPDGWKNSIRHNLSLNPAFRKVEHSMRWQGKKGFFWEVTPERRASVEREVERYLRQEGKLREIDEIDGTAPFPSCLHASIPTMPQAPSTSSGPRPMCEFLFCTGTQPYYDIASSMQRHYPPPLSSLPPPIPPPPVTSTMTHTATPAHVYPPNTTAMITLLDIDQSPSQFAGFSDLTTSTANSALHDLFGLHLSTSPTKSNPHMYTQPPVHTYVVEASSYAPTIPDCSASCGSKYCNIRLRNQALNQLIIPEDQGTDIQTEHAECTNTSSPFYMDSSLLDHCVTLDECFVMSESEEMCESCDVDYLGELPLPPSVHARLGREEGRMGKGVREGTPFEKHSAEEVTEVISETSQAVPKAVGGCAPVSGRRGRRGRRKRRRMPAPRSRGGQDGTKRREIEAVSGGTEQEKKELEKSDPEEGQDMLSHIHPDSEQTMRDTLLPVIQTTLNAGGLSCTVDDGLFTIPESNEPPALIHRHSEVY